MRSAVIGCLLGTLIGGVALGCGDQAGNDASQLEENVADSIELQRDTYAEKRAEGEGVVEAAGEAYEAVLEEGREKAEKK